LLLEVFDPPEGLASRNSFTTLFHFLVSAVRVEHRDANLRFVDRFVSLSCCRGE
jgi:hypothetical protein